jgi:ubiquinone/menaquinone biosynthesis C-methylase UbiE
MLLLEKNTDTAPRSPSTAAILHDFQAAWMCDEVRDRLKRFIEKGLLQGDIVAAQKLFHDLDILTMDNPDCSDQCFKVIAATLDGKSNEVKVDETLRITKRVEQLLPFFLEWEKNERIVDVGCGTGVVLATLGEKLGADPEGLLGVEVFDRKATDRYQHICFSEGKMPIPDNFCKYAMVLMTLHHDVAPLDLMTELHRIMQDNGVIIVRESECESFFDRMFFTISDDIYYRSVHHFPSIPCPHSFRSDAEWQELFQSVGFKVSAVIRPEPDNPFKPIHYVLHKI